MSGHVWQRPAVERRGKNAVAVEDYSGDTFPSFCGGLAYFLTIKVVPPHIYTEYKSGGSNLAAPSCRYINIE